jgi:uncharacterized membrane protein
MHPAFSIGDSLKVAWRKGKAHKVILIQVMLTLFAFEIAYVMAKTALEDTTLGTLALLALTVLAVILQAGFLNIILKIAKGDKVAYKDLIPPFALVWKMFLASLLVGVLVVAGLILLIIPGIYFAIRFSMSRFAVLEGMSVLESFEKSTKLTEGHKWELLLFFLVVIAINIVGAIPFGVGLLVTIPISILAFAEVYLKLKHHSH